MIEKINGEECVVYRNFTAYPKSVLEKAITDYINTGSIFIDLKNMVEQNRIKLIPASSVLYDELTSFEKYTTKRKGGDDTMAMIMVRSISYLYTWDNHSVIFMDNGIMDHSWGYSITGSLMPRRKSSYIGIDYDCNFYSSITDLLNEVIEDESNVIRPIERMYRNNDSQDNLFKPAREDYVLSDNTKKILANSTRIYDKQEKPSHNKNWRKA